MTLFEERERAFEAKYVYDEEQLHLLDYDPADLTSKALAVKDGPDHDERLLDLARQTYLAHGAKDPAGLLPALHQGTEKARLDLLDHARRR